MIPEPSLNIWEHSSQAAELYALRAAGEAEEMDASAQAVELLAPFIQNFDRPAKLLDAGCGSGYLWHSFKSRDLGVDYYGLDYSPSLINIGRRILPDLGLPAEKLICGAMEDLDGLSFDLITLINTLTCCPDFRQPLDRLALTGARVILIRDNFGPETVIRWEEDGYLDPGYNHLKAYWNRWSLGEVSSFLSEYGFRSEAIIDRRTSGEMELVVDKPYFWSWLLAVRDAPTGAMGRRG